MRMKPRSKRVRVSDSRNPSRTARSLRRLRSTWPRMSAHASLFDVSRPENQSDGAQAETHIHTSGALRVPKRKGRRISARVPMTDTRGWLTKVSERVGRFFKNAITAKQLVETLQANPPQVSASQSEMQCPDQASRPLPLFPPASSSDE